MKCSKCGNQLKIGQNFCTKCGTAIENFGGSLKNEKTSNNLKQLSKIQRVIAIIVVLVLLGIIRYVGQCGYKKYKQIKLENEVDEIVKMIENDDYTYYMTLESIDLNEAIDSKWNTGREDLYKDYELIVNCEIFIKYTQNTIKQISSKIAYFEEEQSKYTKNSSYYKELEDKIEYLKIISSYEKKLVEQVYGKYKEIYIQFLKDKISSEETMKIAKEVRNLVKILGNELTSEIEKKRFRVFRFKSRYGAKSNSK